MMPLLKNKNLSNLSFSFWVGSICVLFVFLLAIVSFFWTPYDVTSLEISNRFKTPSYNHFLGTDHFGRDILSMIMVGTQTSIAVAMVAVGIGILFGLPLGLIAAAKRGTFFDDLVRPVTNFFEGIKGSGPILISIEHIIPNILNLLIVQATIQFSLGILAEAALSYVGLGAQPPIPSLGRMLADSQTMISIAPHMAIFPGLFIVITVLGLNLMGDGLRDYFDPKLKVSNS